MSMYAKTLLFFYFFCVGNLSWGASRDFDQSNSTKPETKSAQKSDSKLTLKVRINKKIKSGKFGNTSIQVQKDTTIELLSIGNYDDLAKAIFKEGLKSYQHRRAYQVAIFKSPPSHMNRLYATCQSKGLRGQKQLTEQGIKNGDQLFAIIYNKDANNDDHITLFVDYGYSKEIIMLVIPKDFKEEQLLQLAQDTFCSLSSTDEKNVSFKKRAYRETWLLYPKHIQEVANTHAISPFNLLKNGDRINLRIQPPKEIELSIKVIDSAKGEHVVATFDNHSYVSDMLYFLKEKLNWSIYPKLYMKEEEDGRVVYRHFDLEWRLANIPYFNNQKTVYVKKMPEGASFCSTVGPKLEKDEDFLFLVINKRATGYHFAEQNTQYIKLGEGWTTQKVEDLIPKIRETLQYVKPGNKKLHNYINLKSRVRFYLGKKNSIVKELNLENTLQGSGVESGDTLFAILPSKQNPNEISLFVKNAQTGSILLITESIDQQKKVDIERYTTAIRMQAIRVFKDISQSREDDLPLWDSTILEKTELVAEDNIDFKNLQTGDLVYLKLKEAYSVITIIVKINQGESSIVKIAVPQEETLLYLFEEAKRQEKWAHAGVAKALFRESESTPLHLDQSLAEAGITESTLLYIKPKTSSSRDVKRNSQNKADKQNEIKELISDRRDIIDTDLSLDADFNISSGIESRNEEKKDFEQEESGIQLGKVGKSVPSFSRKTSSISPMRSIGTKHDGKGNYGVIVASLGVLGVITFSISSIRARGRKSESIKNANTKE